MDIEKRILYVEDDRDDGLLLQQAMKPLSSITVQLAVTGEEALSILEKDKLAGRLPGLIVIDVNLPGMNGIKILKKIKKDRQLKDLPIVIFTTAMTDDDVAELEGYNVEGIIKPISWVAYKEMARRMMGYCK